MYFLCYALNVIKSSTQNHTSQCDSLTLYIKSYFPRRHIPLLELQVGFLLALRVVHIADLFVSRAGLDMTCYDMLGPTVFLHRALLE